VVVAAERVARDGRRFAGRRRGVLRPVGQAGGDDGGRAGQEFLRRGAQAAVFGHIIHFAVAAEAEPAFEPGDGLGGVGAGEAERGESERLSPLPDFFGQRAAVDAVARR